MKMALAHDWRMKKMKMTISHHWRMICMKHERMKKKRKNEKWFLGPDSVCGCKVLISLLCAAICCLEKVLIHAHTPAIFNIECVTWTILHISVSRKHIMWIDIWKRVSMSTMSMTFSSRSTLAIPFFAVHLGNSRETCQTRFQHPSSEKFPYPFQAKIAKIGLEKIMTPSKGCWCSRCPLPVTPEAAKPYTLECCTFSRRVIFGMHMFPAVTQTVHVVISK